MAPKDTKNTLRSRSTARVIDALGEGETSVIGGPQGVYLEGTRLEEKNGKRNFDGVRTTFRTGTKLQSYIPGIRAAENEVNIGVQLKNNSPVIRAITDTAADACSIKVRVPQLTNVPNVKTGDVKGTAVTVRISRQNNGGSYVAIADMKISGKTSSQYERSKRIELPAGTGPWLIKVERLTQDSNSQYKRDDTYFGSYTLIYDTKLTYPYTALVGLEVDAQRFGSSFPERAYECQRDDAPYPSNWNPVTRVYTGIWNGSFLYGTHDNPAWYCWELIASNRFGLGDIIASSGIDKWMLYTIAQRCDGLVDDGKGGLEPRFTFNGSVNTRQAAIKLLDAISSVWRGMIYWSAGAVSFAQDAPGVAAIDVTEANTIGGFNRVSSAAKARHTSVLVGWNNPDKLGEIDYVPVVRDDLIMQFGNRPKEIAAFGCSSESQARRLGETILFTEEFETEVITWKSSLDHLKVVPGVLARIFDPSEQGARFAGRIVAAYRNIDLFAKDFSNAAWIKTNAAVTVNAATDQDGNLLADKLTETAVTNAHFISQLHTCAQGETVTHFIVVKAAERDRMSVSISDNTAFAVQANFNIALGTIIAVGAGNAGWTVPIAFIEPAGNGYFKCGITTTKLSNTDLDAASVCGLLNAAGAGSYLGVVNSGVYIAHSQFEVAAAAGPIIEGQAVRVDAGIDPTAPPYDLNVMLPTGAIETRTITKYEQSNALMTVATPFSVMPAADAIWSVTGVSITGELFRVTAIYEKAPNIFEVQALKHDPTKYDLIERKRVIEKPNYSLINSGQLGAPSELDITEFFQQRNGVFEPVALCSWLPSSDPRVLYYEYQFYQDDQDYGDIYRIDGASVDITSVDEGYFTFQVRSCAPNFIYSDWQTKRVYIVGANAKPSDVQNFRCNVTGAVAVLKWAKNDDAITQTYEIRFSPDVNANWNGGIVIAADISKNTGELSTVARVGKFMIKAITKNDVYSVLAASIVNLIGLKDGALVGTPVDESANWYGIPAPFRQFQNTDNAPPWTLTNVTLASGNLRETAVNAVHKSTRGPDLSVRPRDRVRVTFDMTSVGGRNAKLVATDENGSKYTALIDLTAHTVISSAVTGDFVLNSTGVTNLGAGRTSALADFTVGPNTEQLTFELFALNGSSDTYLGVATSGLDWNDFILETFNKTMVKNGSGFLELAPNGAGGYLTSGYYEFANTLSNLWYYDPSILLTKKTNVKFKAEFQYTVAAPAAAIGDFASIGNAPAIAGSSDGITITPQVRVSNVAGPYVYGEWMDLTDALFTGRYFQFRFLVTSDNPAITPVISSAIIRWEIPGYEEQAQGITSGAGNYDVVFAQEFYAVPSVQVTPSVTAALVQITNQTTTGFRVRFENGSGSAVSRVFDWVAQGNGPVIL